jgi:ABC-type amino acid transport system permease subunit
MSNMVKTKRAAQRAAEGAKTTARVTMISIKIAAIVGLASSIYLLSQPTVRFALTNPGDVAQAMEIRSNHNAGLKRSLE